MHDESTLGWACEPGLFSSTSAPGSGGREVGGRPEKVLGVFVGAGLWGPAIAGRKAGPRYPGDPRLSLDPLTCGQMGKEQPCG